MRIDSVKHMVRRSLWRWGFDVVRKEPSVQADLLARHDINLVLDIGAARGSFVSKMREDGYRGKIISFEPLPEYFTQLQQRIIGDRQWQAVNTALGDEDGQRAINVAGNLMSSSFLPMRDTHSAAAPESRYVRNIEVPVARLDSIWNRFVKEDDRVFLKIDAQGYEKKILEGAAQVLPRVVGVQLELSFMPLYDGEETISAMFAYMDQLGFTPVFIENGFHDLTTGHYLQADVVFFRREDSK